MRHAEHAIAAARGIDTGCLPYAPRFDLWFNAHRYQGTMPPEYSLCDSALDIARMESVGGHSVIADFIRPRDPSETVDRGLGLYSLPQFPYRVTLRNVERSVERDDSATTVAYRTPRGAASVRYIHTEDMRRAGASISAVTKHAVECADDVDILVHIFECLDVEADYSGLETMLCEADGDAVVVANVSLPGSPMQFIMRDLMDITTFYYAMNDWPEKLGKLADAIGGFFERIMSVGAACPCDVLLFGANTDETITYPPFYEEHIMPWIGRFASMAHEHGKLVLIHADGENRSLFDLYRQSGIDILEAVATAPMTKCGIREILERADGMTVWGGIPSVVLMEDVYGEAAFDAFMRETLDVVGKRPRFILGVSDTTPPDADFSRLLKIRDMIRRP